MKKTIFLILLFTIVLTCFYLGQSALAQGTSLPSHTQITTEQGGKGPAEIAGIIADIFVGVAGAFLMVIFIYGGFLMITSAGNQEKITRGKKALIWGVIGFMLMLASFLTISLLIKALTQVAAPKVVQTPTPQPPPENTCEKTPLNGQCVPKSESCPNDKPVENTGGTAMCSKSAQEKPAVTEWKCCQPPLPDTCSAAAPANRNPQCYDKECAKQDPLKIAIAGADLCATSATQGKPYCCQAPLPDSCTNSQSKPCVEKVDECYTARLIPATDNAGKCATGMLSTPKKEICCEDPPTICPWSPQPNKTGTVPLPSYAGCSQQSPACCDCRPENPDLPDTRSCYKIEDFLLKNGGNYYWGNYIAWKNFNTLLTRQTSCGKDLKWICSEKCVKDFMDDMLKIYNPCIQAGTDQKVCLEKAWDGTTATAPCVKKTDNVRL